MYLVLSAFTSNPTSLVAATKASEFLFRVCMLPPSILTSSAEARSWCVPFSFKPSWFTRTLLMAYSKAKLKCIGDRASPCFKPFLIGNLPCCPIAFKHYAKEPYVLHPYMAQAAVNAVTLGCLRETVPPEGCLALSTVLASVCLIQENGIHWFA